MIQLSTIVTVTDKSGVLLGQCIKVLGTSSARIASYGDLILISVLLIDRKKFFQAKPRLRQRFQRGTIHRGLVVRTNTSVLRDNGTRIRFSENSIVLVTKKRIPISNRITGPIFKELAF